MAQDDWRVRIELEEERHATDFLARIGLDLGSEARELAKELEDHRLAVSNDADVVFVYAATRDAARTAKQIVATELRELELNAQEIRIEHWLHDRSAGTTKRRRPTPRRSCSRRATHPGGAN